MTEQQIEILEKYFPPEGLIVFKEPNGAWCVATFGDHDSSVAMEELNDDLVGTAEEPGILCQLLNKHYPPPSAP